jgi:hypothetical protein
LWVSWKEAYIEVIIRDDEVKKKAHRAVLGPIQEESELL